MESRAQAGRERAERVSSSWRAGSSLTGSRAVRDLFLQPAGFGERQGSTPRHSHLGEGESVTRERKGAEGREEAHGMLTAEG